MIHMNSFEENFFQKYTPEWQQIQHIVHAHPVIILGKIFLWLMLWVVIPVILYYYSFRLKWLIPFYIIESWLLIVYVKIIYDIFDWYNDVWIITDAWLVDVDWSLFKTNMSTLDFWNIEWMEVEENSIFDKLLNKWDLIVHKIWADWFVLPECFKPYSALNTVETIKNQIDEGGDDDHELDRFDMIMDTLWWVVENYLHNQWKDPKNMNLEDEEVLRRLEHTEKYSKNKNSIDLR